MSNLHELNVYIEENGQRDPFSLTITQPEKAEDAEDYYCTVIAPRLFNKEKNIYGVDAEQVAHLAVKLVTDLLAGRRLVDEYGQSIEL